MPQILTEVERDGILSAVDTIIKGRKIGSGGRFDLTVVLHQGLTVLELNHHGGFTR